jgi:hypothetical protein
MSFRKWMGIVVVWVASLVAAGVWAHAQAPAVQPQPPTIITGSDVGFRIDSWSGNTPVGKWVVRSPAGGQWVEPKVQNSIQRLHSN